MAIERNGERLSDLTGFRLSHSAGPRKDGTRHIDAYVPSNYVVFHRCSGLRGTGVIQRLERALSPVSAYIVPVAISLLGTILLSFGVLSVG